LRESPLIIGETEGINGTTELHIEAPDPALDGRVDPGTKLMTKLEPGESPPIRVSQDESNLQPARNEEGSSLVTPIAQVSQKANAPAHPVTDQLGRPSSEQHNLGEGGKVPQSMARAKNVRVVADFQSKLR